VDRSLIVIGIISLFIPIIARLGYRSTRDGRWSLGRNHVCDGWEAGRYGK
jgi:hypothetical protein